MPFGIALLVYQRQQFLLVLDIINPYRTACHSLLYIILNLDDSDHNILPRHSLNPKRLVDLNHRTLRYRLVRIVLIASSLNLNESLRNLLLHGGLLDVGLYVARFLVVLIVDLFLAFVWSFAGMLE